MTLQAVLQGVPRARAILAGQELFDGADTWEINRRELRTLNRTQSGRLVETVLARPPGYPMRSAYIEVGLTWSNILRAGEDRIRRIRTRPGLRDLVLWRREDLAYAADGARTEFRLANRWINAIDRYTPSGGIPAVSFAPVLRIDDVEISFSAADVEVYNAGPPPSGEGWWLKNGSVWKVEPAPSEDAKIDLLIFPVYRVAIEPGETERLDGARPLVEPQRLLLIEDAS